MSYRVRIPFMLMFRDVMSDGRKTTTARSQKMGEVGDWFGAFGCRYEITFVQKLPLSTICNCYYEREGFYTPEKFIEVWKRLHPIRGYDPDWRVYLHGFKRRS